jgi:hypothetical protein
MYFCTDTDNTIFIKVTKSVFTYIRNIPCDFFRAELCITSFNFMFNYMD